MRKEWGQAGIVAGLTTVLCGVLFPSFLLVTGQLFFDDRAQGSLVEREGEWVGSMLIAQPFTSDNYFHGRPSAVDQLTGQSGGDNLAESHPDRPAYDSTMPGAVETSGSGLDPHISLEHATAQVERVAEARGLQPDAVRAVIEDVSNGGTYVNVLRLNLQLDESGQ
ncbi:MULTISPECIES: potassium-transporting ATPase subunit C [Exiguobacterium]|uniref:potassium-transporting ATPase subunit C n=1 Tax=Exiguobacterium TaxID=33986 RepID=UPI001BEAB30D|nr:MULTISPECIES: potassium-transporting ATPase subunit C [Exiguobacterium]MCT4776027.1 potassium-transporting ATPase subunit C [Exiguobacterium aquaticum]MCT4788063.1 potassium-transporting ATPase subunit C [Exiguobacterium mexicanum]